MKKLFIKLLSLLLSLFALSSCSFIKNKNLHGEDLAKLSNDELYEAVYFQNLDIVTSFESEKLAGVHPSFLQLTAYTTLKNQSFIYTLIDIAAILAL